MANFLKRSRAVDAGFAGFILWVLACGISREPPQKAPAGPRPDILLITLDTTRADRIGAYGYAAAETPALDALAESGVLFARAFSPVPMTLPAHASILTGLDPAAHGLRLNGFYKLGDEIATLPELLREEGYQTGAFVSAFVLDGQFGLSRGFDVYDDAVAEKGPARHQRRGDATVDAALGWIAEIEDAPFFLWVHLFDPHLEYAAPEPYASRFADRPYDGEIAFADAQVGRLLEGLRSIGRDQSTLVIATSDHGEGLGEHGELTHSLFLYDTTLRVPLIIRPPRRAGSGRLADWPWEAGTRVDLPVGLIDIAPTIADLLELPERPDFDGLSLMRAGSSKHPANKMAEDRVLFAETLYPLSLGWSPIVAARAGSLKYLHSAEPELYDVASDPEENTELLAAGESAPQRLLSLAESYSLDVASSLSPFNGIDAAMEASLASPAAADVIEAIQDLGYLGAGVARAAGDDVWALPDPKSRVPAFDAINDARAKLRHGDPQGALDLLAPFETQERANPVYLQVSGEARVASGQWERGLELLLAAQEIAPGDPEAIIALVNGLVRGGKAAQAIEPLERLVKSFPDYAVAWDQLGMASGMAGDFERAVAAGTRAVDLQRSNPAFLKNLGVTWLASGNPEKALLAFKRTVELGPESADYRFHLGLAYAACGKIRHAAVSFRKTLALEPAHAAAKQKLKALEKDLLEVRSPIGRS